MKRIEMIINENFDPITDKSGFNLYSKAYIRTTENINGYYDDIGFVCSKVMTVIVSSDHISEAVEEELVKLIHLI